MLGQNEGGELHYAHLVHLRGADVCRDQKNFLEEVLPFCMVSVWHMFWPETIKFQEGIDMILDHAHVTLGF